MKNAMNQLAFAVLQKNTLQDYDLRKLKQLAGLYPYSSALQLLLAVKLRAENKEDYISQLEKTRLHIPDALRLEHLLNQKGAARIESKKKSGTVSMNTIVEAVTIPERINVDETNNNQSPAIPEPDKEDEYSFSLEIAPVETPQPAEPFNEYQDEKQALPAQETEKKEVYTFSPALTAVETSKPAETFKEFTGDNPPLPVWEPERAEEPFLNPVIPTAQPIITVGAEEEQRGDSAAPAIQETTEQEQPELITKPELPGQDSNENGENQETEAGMPVLEIPVLKMEPIDPQTAEISFEPYHTVDYFASQGIRFREEEKPRDKFGQQLKSFTEWLKLLKSAPATETVVVSGPAAEEKVEQLAAHSLAEREVVTEAMAEVWEKQGKHEKARAIYHKLSLLNPSKSSYFAAKIDQLKQS